jgi:hypothetical protein
MTPPSEQDLSAQWNLARRLYPIYFELAREFVIDVQACPDLESGLDTPGPENVEQARHWLEEMDQRIQVHQLRQFLQTSSVVDQDGLLSLLKHFLANSAKPEAVRDKIDFLLVQYFSQAAPSRLDDNDVDLGYVAQALEPALGPVELKAPVWLNALDRVLESARHCRSLDELLHGGVLAQGRKAKLQAGDLFFLPIALVAFTRFGYLMRRAFFRLMHGELNAILDGLNELEEKGVEVIDCRRAQFSAEEPVARLRMICQSWKVMFQAEYSSGQPLRMLVDLRASVDHALGRGAAAEADAKTSDSAQPAAAKSSPAASAKAAPAATAKATAAGAAAPPSTRQERAPVSTHTTSKTALPAAAKPKNKFAAPAADAPEFEVSSSPEWDPEGGTQPGKKK